MDYLSQAIDSSAFFGALIFAVHPVNVESVAWIAQRKGLLAMLFFLLSILCYLKREIPWSSLQNGIYRIASPLAPRPSPLWYWLSLLAFVLGMLSKGSVAVLPVLLLGIMGWLRPLTRKDLWRTMPFFLVAAVLIFVNLWFQTHGMENEIRTAGFAERLLGAGAVMWFYLYKALLPLNLMFIYPEWRIQVGNWSWWLPLMAAVAVTAVLWQYRQGWSRPFLYAWGFFCVTLLPVLGFTDVGFMKYSLVSDHYQHLAIIGVIALVAAGWSVWHQHQRGVAHLAANAVAVLVIGALLLLTWQQNRLYRDAETLYRATLQNNPDCWVAHFNLGIALVNLSRPEEAIENFNQTLRLRPDYYQAHFNLANAFLLVGRLQDGLDEYQQAIRMRPDYNEAIFNLGNALLQSGRSQEAIEQYQCALQIKPNFPQAHNNLGAVLAKAGNLQEAIKHYEQAIQSKPDYFEAIYNLGFAMEQTGRPREAIEQYEQVLRIKPDHYKAHYYLGNMLLQTDRIQEAIVHYQQALRFKPDYIEAYGNLALAYAKTQKTSQALAAAQKGLELARSQGQMAQAKQIEDWLNSYRAGQSDTLDAVQPSK